MAAMEIIVKQGRCLFGAAIVAFGVENLVCARSRDPFLPAIPWVPSYPWLAYVTGTFLLAAGLCIAVNLRTRAVALLLGVFFLLCDLVLQIPRVAPLPWDVGMRTCAFETLTMCASALMLAGALPAEGQSFGRWQAAINGLIGSGRYLFAASAIIFGVDHYLVFNLIVFLVPKWIPGGGWFWANLTAIAFIAAGISIAVKIGDRWASFMLGLMFLLWFLVLHAPRIASYPRILDPHEWSSAFIALGICGGAWILTWSLSAMGSQNKET
jgi:uncharacterized membrane protein YphA (DoxX/SURF4 family)